MLRCGVNRIGIPVGGREWLRTPAMVLAAIAGGALLAAAYPPLEVAPLAWLAFVPVLIAARYAAPRRAAWLGAVAGLVFWLTSTVWLLRLTAHAPVPLVVLGWLALAAYAALYTAAFTWAFSAVWRWRPLATGVRNGVLLAVGPIVWAGLEYLRCRAFGGFPWNPLGVSQYRNLPLIQIAEWSGVHGVSALVMLFNLSLTLTGLRLIEPAQRRRGFHVELAAAALLLALCWRFGIQRARHFPPAVAGLHAAVVQPGIAQEAKWEEGMAERVFDHLGEAMDDAVMLATIMGGRPPDLVVLPETVFPYFADHPETRRFVESTLAALAVPILAGVMAREPWRDGERYFNRSALYLPLKGPAIFYDKQHLVPFGEAIPFSRWLPWLERLAPLGWNITPGAEATVIRLPGSDIPFSVTICFEDAYPYISRRFARQGARLLVNQTNDAWFDPSSASRQHLAQGVFRSIETRLPTLRVANTGISALIDRSGRIRDVLPPTATRHLSAAVAFWTVAPAPVSSSTLYTRYGDWTFALPAAFMALAVLVLTYRRSRFL